jgi:hypothetical protein
MICFPGFLRMYEYKGNFPIQPPGRNRMKTESKNTFKVLTFTLLVFALLLINDRNAIATAAQAAPAQSSAASAPALPPKA